MVMVVKHQRGTRAQLDAAALAAALEPWQAMYVTDEKRWAVAKSTTEYEFTDKIPDGGTTGQVLSKASGSNHDVEWVDPPSGGAGEGVPEGGDEGQVLVKSSEDDFDTEWKSPNPVAVKVYKADNKALNVVTTEDGHYVKVTKADGVTELTVSVTNNGVSPPVSQGPIPRYLAEDPLPVTNIGPIWHDGYASIMTWRTIGSYTGYASLEVGKVQHFDIGSVPPGYVASNADISANAFEALRAAVGQSTTRDARGVVIRGLDNGRGLDPSRNRGTYQADGIRQSTFDIRAAGATAQYHLTSNGTGEFVKTDNTGVSSNTTLTTHTYTQSLDTMTLGSVSETRMKNLALPSFWKF